MDIDSNDILGVSNIDKSKLPPIQQKRIVAFVNHFIISTCSFLNNFAAQCETRFLEIERKMQKVEAALIILESKLSSISGLENINNSSKQNEAEKNENTGDNKKIETTEIDKATISTENEQNKVDSTQEDTTKLNGIKASEDIRYKKYFKMLQVGVPVNAVKAKMQVEGYDPNILDDPNLIIPDGIKEECSTNAATASDGNSS